ncbi:Na(+)-translocating NADH-quinone reductase subunit C [Alphaproteobacteria bacterium]|nr:Na(+)-translocating NADH-quinone reductase subunit C [Alphaproteobacteria bacterium]MDC3172310.1 Na(+)-translocating NADH-quinone reductase subunit C [Alphaproteobacteria bacterium]
MSESNNIFTKFKNMPVDGIVKTIIVATALCFVCSMVVSFAAVNLKSIQEVNKAIDKQKNILQVAGVYHEGIDVNKTFSSFQPLVVDLNSGKFTDKFDPSIFDDKKAAQDPLLSVSLDNDPASIGRRTNYATIYLLKKDDGSLDKVILPIHGYGLWSTLYGFIALEDNLNDIFGLQFYQHAETPGLGAEVDNPKWKAQWKGKKLNNENGELMIQVAKTQKYKDHHIDALAGATLTSNGVDNLVKFWMGKDGFQKFLNNLKNGAA